MRSSWDADVRRPLVVVGEAEQLRFAPAGADEGDSDRQSTGISGRNRDISVAHSCKYGKIEHWLHSRDNESYADKWKAFRLYR
jgi:hypothetical protein